MERCVVFVDDDSNVLDGLSRAFRGQRDVWDMAFHSSAVSALAALDGRRSCVVVTDWNMPSIDGVDLCARLREYEAQQHGASFWVILLTGSLERDAAVEGLDRGADDFVRKPCDTRELAARIRNGFRVLEAQAALREARALLSKVALEPRCSLEVAASAGVSVAEVGARLLPAELVARAEAGLGLEVAAGRDCTEQAASPSLAAPLEEAKPTPAVGEEAA